MQVEYVARKKFKYGSQVLNPGDVWQPSGSKHDEAVKRHLVTMQEVKPKPKRTTRSKKANGTSSK